jgi:hypothetical protein
MNKQDLLLFGPVGSAWQVVLSSPVLIIKMKTEKIVKKKIFRRSNAKCKIKSVIFR